MSEGFFFKFKTHSRFGTDFNCYLYLRFIGVSKNVLLDKDGTYYSNSRLKELLLLGGTGPKDSKMIGKLDSKENRSSWANNQYRNKKSMKKK